MFESARPRKASALLITAALAFTTTLVAAPSADASSAYRIRVLNAFASKSAFARSINASGQVAGGFWDSAGNLHAFYTVGGRVVDLGYGDAYAINDRGDVAGYLEVDVNTLHAFLFDGTMHDLGAPEGSGSFAYDVNDKGQVVGVSGGHPFLYDGAMHDLGTPTGAWGAAYGINDKGQIVGEAEVPGEPNHPMLWDASGIHDLEGAISAAAGGLYRIESLGDINDDGRVIGHMTPIVDGNGEGFTYDIATHAFRRLPALTSADEFVYPMRINALGQVIGYGALNGTCCRPILWDGASTRDLGLPGRLWGFAMDISDNGLVSGELSTKTADRAFILTIR